MKSNLSIFGKEEEELDKVQTFGVNDDKSVTVAARLNISQADKEETDHRSEEKRSDDGSEAFGMAGIGREYSVTERNLPITAKPSAPDDFSLPSGGAAAADLGEVRNVGYG